MPDIANQYYPFERIQGYGTLPELENVPYMLRAYLMDMPSAGYTPPDDNRYFRCQLMKYLYYDGDKPLCKPLPTPEQKMQICFDPDQPTDPPTDKGYRIFAQSLVSQAQTRGATLMRIFMGRIVPVDMYTAEASVHIVFLTNANYEANTRGTALNRTFTMACLAQRALSGVNLGAGVGTMYFNRRGHGDCSITPLDDQSTNVGYMLTMGLTVMGTDANNQ